MKRIKESFKKQGSLFATHYINDRLENDDKVYLFDNLVDQLDLSELHDSYSERGGSLFSPRDMFAILLFSYFEGISSAYKIYDNVKSNIRYIYLAGTLKISRRSISDFRLRNIAFLRKIFLSTVKMANDIGLIDIKEPFALDGSKFEANASMSKTGSKSEWKDVQDKIIQQVENYLAECEKSDRQVLSEDDDEKDRQKKFDDIKERIKNLKVPKREVELKPPKKKASDKKSKSKKKIKQIDSDDDAQELLDFYDKIEQACEQNESNYVNLTDPDCRLMKTNSVSKEAYNVQIISNNQIITAVDVITDEQDQNQFIPMVNQLQENLEEIGVDDPISLLSDAGYNAGYNLDFADDEKNIDAYISMFQRKSQNKPGLYDDNPEFEKENFDYDERSNSWICPNQKHLKYQKTSTDNNSIIRHYHSTIENCIKCTVRDFCLKSKADIRRGYRTLEDRYLLLRKKMKQKMDLEASKKIYKKRATEIEPIFGQIKKNKNFTKFSLTGTIKVKSEFLIVTIAHNLQKILNHKRLQAI